MKVLLDQTQFYGLAFFILILNLLFAIWLVIRMFNEAQIIITKAVIQESDKTNQQIKLKNPYYKEFALIRYFVVLLLMLCIPLLRQVDAEDINPERLSWNLSLNELLSGKPYKYSETDNREYSDSHDVKYGDNPVTYTAPVKVILDTDKLIESITKSRDDIIMEIKDIDTTINNSTKVIKTSTGMLRDTILNSQRAQTTTIVKEIDSSSIPPKIIPSAKKPIN